jgi:hypothetical protein
MSDGRDKDCLGGCVIEAIGTFLVDTVLPGSDVQGDAPPPNIVFDIGRLDRLDVVEIAG